MKQYSKCSILRSLEGELENSENTTQQNLKLYGLAKVVSRRLTGPSLIEHIDIDDIFTA